MHSKIRKILSLLLVVVLTFGSASAFSSNLINSKFEYVLWQIEDNSLYTQNEADCMPRNEIDRWNAYLEEHPEEFDNVVNDYLGTLDTHSMYLSGNDYDESFSSLVGYSGIGVTMQQTPDGVIVSGVNRSGPAYTAGVQVGDRIVAIDGKDVTKMTTNELAALARGDAGTTVVLTVERGGKRLDFTLIRAHIQQEYVSSETVADGVEYIRIEAMGSQTDLDDFREIWNGLDEKNTRAVILDLRSNGGGLIDVAWGMADTMLEKAGAYMGAIQWREDQGGLEKHYATGGGLPLNKICVLVDGNTASAAEMLTGILKEVGGAEVIGTTTYGKGQGQYHLTMLDGVSKLVITCLEMHLPQTGCWEGKGIAPTIPVTGGASVSSYLNGLAALDTTKNIVYGQQSEQVRALSGRLFLLGYASGASDVFDTDLLSALRRFQKDQGLTQRIVADKETMEAVNAAVAALDSGDQQIDKVYYTALDLCKQAAAQPARYQTTANGGWRAA